MTSERVRIVLELDPAGDPIAGSLSSERVPVRPFSGWLALGRALEDEISHARDDARAAEFVLDTGASLGGSAASMPGEPL